MKENNFYNTYLKRAQFVARILQLAPFIRMVGLNGSVASGQATKDSDIDFLIITAEKRIWTCRAFVTVLTHLTGWRRYGYKKAGRICLNRYQTENFLKILPENEYHARVFSPLKPLLNIDSTYEEFITANFWMKKFGCPVKVYKAILPNKVLNFYRQRIEEFLSQSFGNWLEKKLKIYQTKRIKADIRTASAPAGRIRISDQELCFHPLKNS